MSKNPFQAAVDYHVNCELYDRSVCTGPMGRDGILPANGRERVLINENATSERIKAAREAEMPMQEMDKIIRSDRAIDEANRIVREKTRGASTQGKQESGGSDE